MTTNNDLHIALDNEGIIVTNARLMRLSVLVAYLVEDGETKDDAIRSIVEGILEGEADL